MVPNLRRSKKQPHSLVSSFAKNIYTLKLDSDMAEIKKRKGFSSEKMKRLWSDSFGKNPKDTSLLPLRKMLLIALAVSFGFAAFSLLLRIWLPPEIPLFYGLPEGNRQLASSWFIPLPSLVSTLIIVINTFLAALVKNEFLKRVLVFSAISVAAFSIVTTIKIFFLVASF